MEIYGALEACMLKVVSSEKNLEFKGITFLLVDA